MITSKTVVRILLVVDLALAIFIVASLGFGASTAKKYLAEIEVGRQSTGGAETINYLPIITEDADWGNASEKTRENIAKYAVDQSVSKAEKDGVTLYNVMGLAGDDRAPIFLYTQTSGVITIYDLSGEKADEVKYA
ncbi:MAG: hypothetical protein LBR14_04385 [Clostridiales Family XIII bacterium]|nr:hypothetical protein [Clostridiales Family XIII bacterium]